MSATAPHRAVIAGGGVAGLEALVALRSLAGDRVDITLVAPDDAFVVRALSVEDPFGRAAAHRHPLDEICDAHDATFVRDVVDAVDPAARSVTLRGGERLPYDSLLVATGARPVQVLDAATTFRGLQDAEAMHGLIQDVEGGYISRLAFVVPPGVSWPLPLYELALMTAERAASLDLPVSVTVVTPEDRPLAIFGPAACDRVDEILAAAGIPVIAGTFVRDVVNGVVLGTHREMVAAADRVVALPRLLGVAMPGLPADADGFIPIDDHGAVRGVDGVFAAGDGTSFPIKQGGLAAQEADAAARAIAVRAGTPMAARPFRPTLRAKLLTGAGATYLRQAIAGGAGEDASTAAGESPWWPPSKVAAPYLAPYLERTSA